MVQAKDGQEFAETLTQGAEDASPAEEAEEEAEAEEQDSDEDIDWKAEAERKEQQIAKLQNDLKSLRGNRQRSFDIQDAITTLQDEIGALRKQNEALYRISLNPDGAEEEWNKAAREISDSRSQQRFEQNYKSLVADLKEAVADDEGNPVLDLYNAPELSDVRVRWNEAQTQGDEVALARLVGEAAKITQQAERTAHKKALDEANKKAREQRKKARSDAGNLAVGGGRTASGDSDNLPASQRIARGLEASGGLAGWSKKMKQGQ